MRISDWSSDVCSSDLLAVVVGADEEVDVRRTLAVAAKRGQQLLGRAARGHAVAAGQDAAEAVPALFVGDDRSAHVERRLHASRVEVRLEARSEESRVGKECVSPFRSGWVPYI